MNILGWILLILGAVLLLASFLYDVWMDRKFLAGGTGMYMPSVASGVILIYLGKGLGFLLALAGAVLLGLYYWLQSGAPQ